MPIKPPSEIAALLAKFDARADMFELLEVLDGVEKAVADPKALSPEGKRGWWAEYAAFAFEIDETSDGGPWKTYYQPIMTAGQGESIQARPDLREADADVIAYWSERAKAVKHPALAARYADLVWDTTKFVTKGKPGIEFARLAIDSYVAGLYRDDGVAWSDNFYNLRRALGLALSIKDEKRVDEVVLATLDYANKTEDDRKLGTYCYLLDNLLPPQKGPTLSQDQERTIVEKFETIFAEMTKPGGLWDLDPHRPHEVGRQLADYYHRVGKPEERTRIFRAIAEGFERRARKGDALGAILFLGEARKHYLEAGLRTEADRVQAEAQKVGSEAEAQMVPTGVEYEVSTEELEGFLNSMVEGGLEDALLRLTLIFIPDQDEVAKQLKNVAKDSPMYAMFSDAAKKMGHGHIEADVGDDRGDPDGLMIHRTAEFIQFDTPWISWTFGRMIQDGLTASRFADFVCLCELFTPDRVRLVRQGLEAHFTGDYARAIHFLVPQIERALVNLPPLAGKPSNKSHRTGRGVMQFKNLNDLLAKDQWPISDKMGENLRMYLLATLAHPKGLNIRNDVCHGLWPMDRFTRIASERVLHVLLAVSMLRQAKQEGECGGTTTDPAPAAPSEIPQQESAPASVTSIPAP